MDETTPPSDGREGEGSRLTLRRHRLIPLAVSGLAGIGVVLAAFQLAERNIDVAVVLLVLAASFAPAPWWHSRRRAVPCFAETSSGSGLLLPVNARTWAFATSALVLGAGFVEVGGALAVRAADEGDRAVGIVVLVPFAALGLALGGRALQAIASRWRRHLGLLLTADAIVVATERRPLRIGWDAVVAIRPHWVRLSEGWLEIDDEVRNLLTIEVRPRLVTRRPRPLDASRLACEPELALAVLRFYLAHPEARRELQSSAVLGRVEAIAVGK